MISKISNNIERIEFLSKGILFKGSVYKPENPLNCRGVIIFTHGLGYCDKQYKIDWDFFSRNGYLLVLYNLRGHAGNKGVWMLHDCVDDLSELITFIQEKYKFSNISNISLMAHSTGALISLYAALKDSRIKVGCMVTTVTCLTHSFLYWFESGFNQAVKPYFTSKGELPSIINQFMDDSGMLSLYQKKQIPALELEVAHRYGMLRSQSWNTFFNEIANSSNILDDADKLSIPLILFRGKDDEVMDPKKTNALYEIVQKKVQAKLIVTSSPHHFQDDNWSLIQEEALKFFEEIFSNQKRTKTDA